MAEFINVRFSPTLSLVPGTRERIVRIEAVTDPMLIPHHEPSDWQSRIQRPPFAEVMSTFLRAVEMGCFSGPTAGAPIVPIVHRSAEREEQGFRLYEAEVSLPALPEGAFATLVQMAKCSQALSNGLTSLSIQETAAAELPRISIERIEPLPAPAVPFAVANSVEGERKEIQIVVTFSAPMSESALHTAETLFAAWGAVLSLGGFAGSGLPFSTGGVTDVARHLPEEVIATVELFNGKAEAWQALLRGLFCLHATERIASIEIY